MGIIERIRSNVALNCSRMGNVSPKEYAALVIVELLPNVKRIQKDEGSSTFIQLLNIIEDLSSRVKRHHYSKDANHLMN